MDISRVNWFGCEQMALDSFHGGNGLSGGAGDEHKRVIIMHWWTWTRQMLLFQHMSHECQQRKAQLCEQQIFEK